MSKIERKKIWLNEMLEEQRPVIDTTKISQQDIETLDSLCKDANDESLLQMKNVLDKELFVRGKSITIILYAAGYSWSPKIEKELKSIIVDDYLKEKSNNPLVKELVTKALKEKDEEIEESENDEEAEESEGDEEIEDQEQEEEQIIASPSDILVNETLDYLDDEELWNEDYGSASRENPFMIRAIENLQKRGEEDKTVMLYTFSLPLGKSYVIEEHEKFGEYPIIQ